jgi:hypothetical protein
MIQGIGGIEGIGVIRGEVVAVPGSDISLFVPLIGVG